MAFALPVLVGIGVGAVAVSTGVGGLAAAASVIFSTKSKLKPAKVKVEQPMNLSIGDHISLSSKQLPFSHAIVVEAMQMKSDTVKVIYCRGSETTAEVEVLDVDLKDIARRGNLYKHQYEALISYPNTEVADRAKSFAAEYSAADRRGVIQNYWPFFEDGEHFANWCQIGTQFKTGVRAVFSSDYTTSTITDIHCLQAGDHVTTEDGTTGIIVGINQQMSQLALVRFPAADSRGPGKLIVNLNNRKLIRQDYDVAIGSNGERAKEAALKELTTAAKSYNNGDRVPIEVAAQTTLTSGSVAENEWADAVYGSGGEFTVEGAEEMATGPMPYNNGHQFAMRCRTSAIVSPELASTLARARMLGRVWAWVADANSVGIGDHIAFNSGAVYYYQHAIVKEVEVRHAEVIYLTGNVSDRSQCSVKLEKIDLMKYISKKQVLQYFYDAKKWPDSEAIVGRATSLLDKTADKLPYKDPEHFATWCKTASYQLQC